MAIREEGTTTTPFDMAVMNQIDRFHLALAALRRLPQFAERSAQVAAALERKLDEHRIHVCEHGEDMPEIRSWSWPYSTAAEAGD